MRARAATLLSAATALENVAIKTICRLVGFAVAKYITCSRDIPRTRDIVHLLSAQADVCAASSGHTHDVSVGGAPFLHLHSLSVS